nr:hypothetical protein [Gammaproteobacteria bacterium]
MDLVDLPTDYQEGEILHLSIKNAADCGSYSGILGLSYSNFQLFNSGNDILLLV